MQTSASEHFRSSVPRFCPTVLSHGSYLSASVRAAVTFDRVRSGHRVACRKQQRIALPGMQRPFVRNTNQPKNRRSAECRRPIAAWQVNGHWGRAQAAVTNIRRQSQSWRWIPCSLQRAATLSYTSGLIWGERVCFEILVIYLYLLARDPSHLSRRDKTCPVSQNLVICRDMT